MTIEPLPHRPARRISTLDGYRASVEAVVCEMRTHPEFPLDLNAMAGLANVSRCHFDRVFREVTGVSPRQFQTAVRLNTASRLLLTTGRSVTDVCYDVGYESLGTFVATFTHTFGLSPQRLREVAATLHHPWPPGVTAALVAKIMSDAEPPLIKGEVVLDSAFDGIIFIGVFPTPMPVRAPFACTILSAPGPFTLSVLTSGYVLGVAIPACERPLDFLLNDRAWRGGGHFVAPGAVQEISLTLRPPDVLDPPMNIPLPYLIAKYMGQRNGG